MKNIPSKFVRILAIAPSTRGFGFAVLEGQEMLVDWGNKSVKGDKTARSLAKVEGLLAQYQPDVLVVENTAARKSRRSSRIQILSQRIMDLGKKRKIRVALLSREQVKKHILPDGEGTKHDMAAILANRFEAELLSSLPPRRRLWMSEDRRMDTFDAVALAVVFGERVR